MNSEQVQIQIKELESLRSQMRAWRLAVTLVILLMVIICVGTLINSIYGLTQPGPRQEQFVAELSTGLQQGAMADIQQIGTQTLNSIDFPAEFAKLNARTPEIAEATLKEMETLSQSLPERGEKVLNATFGEMIQSRETKIREMYPDVTEDKVHALGTNLTEEATMRTAQITQRLFDPHLKSMNAIVEDIVKIQHSEAVNPREVPTWQMALLIFDIAREDFRGLEAYEGLNRPAGTAAGKGKGVKVQGAKSSAVKAPGAKAPGAKAPGARPQAVKAQGSKPKATTSNATKKGY